MKKKILFWILGIIGVLVIAGGVYAYTVYSNVSNTLNTVHKPLIVISPINEIRK